MTMTTDKCAELAARMLDVELRVIISRIVDEDEMTSLQQAVVREWQRRQQRSAAAPA